MPESGSSPAGFLSARVVHLHASRFCNLACRHCYSASGPTRREELSPRAVLAALATLRSEGYEILSLSGGEPLLYSGFETVARGAADLGFRINLVSNGAPVGGHLLDVIAETTDLVAISLDGAPERHVEMRGHPEAFAWAERALDRLGGKMERFGIAFCLSRESLTDMPWAVDFARQKGAAMVQFHPFAPTGRGVKLDERLSLTPADQARAYLIANLLESSDGPGIHLDLASVDGARQQGERDLMLEFEDASGRPLVNLVNPIILDDRGMVLPLSFGIHEGLAVGTLGDDLPAQIARYKKASWHDLRGLIRIALDRLEGREESFVDWFHHVVETSHVEAGAKLPGMAPQFKNLEASNAYT